MSEKFTDNDFDNIFRQSLDNTETQPSESFWIKASEDALFKRNLAHTRQLAKWKITAYSLAAMVVALSVYAFYSKTQAGINSNTTSVTSSKPATPNTSTSVQSSNNTPMVANATNAPVAVNTSNQTKNIITPAPVSSIPEKKNSVPTHMKTGRSLNTSPVNALPPVAYNSTAPETKVPTVKENMGVNQVQPQTNLTASSGEIAFATQQNIYFNHADNVSSSISPDIISPVSGISIPQHKNLLSRLSLSLFYEPYLSDELLESDNDDIVTFNNTTGNEEEQNPYQLGIRLGYAINKHWSIVTGCYYYNFKVVVSPTAIFAQSYDGNIGYHFQTSMGNVTCPYGGNVCVGDMLTVNGTATANYISVPLLLKYNFLTGGRLGFYITAGGATNIVASREMSIYWKESNWEQGYNTEGIESTKNIYFSYYIAPGISYNIFHGISVYAEPSLQGSPILWGSGSNSKNSSPFIGGGGGITFHL